MMKVSKNGFATILSVAFTMMTASALAQEGNIFANNDKVGLFANLN